MKKSISISLGGSLIYPDKPDLDYIRKFKRLILKHSKDYKFIIICGGGALARRKIALLKKRKKPIKQQSLAGIQATRNNAKILIKEFGRISNSQLKKTVNAIISQLSKKDLVIAGAAGYHPKETSDATAAKIAHELNSKFINLSNIEGLYTSDPSEDKNAKLIKKINWKSFEKLALKVKYKPGQHFILDQTAAKLIRKNKTQTFLLGKNLKNLDNFLSGKKFTGTTIKG